jgi:hypothetical protein
MKKRRIAILLGLIWAPAIFAQGPAQTDPTSAHAPAGQIKSTHDAKGHLAITDAAGRVHKVMPMGSITPAQRKAAALRAKEKRAAFARGGAQPATTRAR